MYVPLMIAGLITFTSCKEKKEDMKVEDKRMTDKW